MVARRRGDDTALPNVAVELFDTVVSAAEFETEYWLQVLTLQEHLLSQASR